MAVLHDGAGEQDAEGDGAGGEEIDPEKLGLRFGDDTDAERHKQQHPRQPFVLFDQGGKVEEMVEQGQRHQHAERPEQHRQEVVLDDMLPQMFLQEMLGAESHHYEGEQCQNAENDIFAMQVVMVFLAIKVMMPLMMMHIAMKFSSFSMVLVLMMMLHRLVVMLYFRLGSNRRSLRHGAVLMGDEARAQSDQIKDQSEDEDGAGEGDFLDVGERELGMTVLVGMLLMHFQGVGIVGVEGAFLEDEMGKKAAQQSHHQHTAQQRQRGFRTDGEQQEGGVAEGADHAGHESAERQHAVGVERHNGEAADTARNESEERGHHNLQEGPVAEFFQQMP